MNSRRDGNDWTMHWIRNTVIVLSFLAITGTLFLSGSRTAPREPFDYSTYYADATPESFANPDSIPTPTQ